MAKVLYTAEAHVTGGRDEGHGKTSDGNLEVDIRVPKELGGDEDNQGTNPEQLFAVGYAACFESAIKVVGRRLKQKVEDVEIDSKVHLMPENRGFKLAVEMDVDLPSVKDAEQRSEVIKNAHAVCPYSNATRGNIDVTIRVDGREVGSTTEEPRSDSQDGDSGNDSKTKDELLEKAQELDIEGRSTMTKDELAEAVEKAE
jgi:osmotically inducible protein OsmC